MARQGCGNVAGELSGQKAAPRELARSSGQGTRVKQPVGESVRALPYCPYGDVHNYPSARGAPARGVQIGQ
jgi:hypothetical protein